jgi:hypothetical protein
MGGCGARRERGVESWEEMIVSIKECHEEMIVSIKECHTGSENKASARLHN